MDKIIQKRKEYYEKNKEKIIAKAMERYEKKKLNGKKLIPRLCSECGIEFIPLQHNGEKCCSDACRHERRKKAHMKWYYTDKGQETYKEYQQSDKYKTYSKTYRQRPEVKKDRFEYTLAWRKKRQEQVTQFMKNRQAAKSITFIIEK